jgi:hypothetical protein
MKDWMSRSHEDLHDQAEGTVNYLTGDVLNRIGIVGPILDWYDNTFLIEHARFNAAFAAWKDPAERTPAKQAALDDAEKDFRKVYRSLYTGYMKSNPLVTNEDLVKAEFPKRHEGGGTPVRKPTTLIVMTTDTSKPGRVGIHFRDEKATGTAKPEGVHGGEMVYGIFDVPPTDWEQLTHNVFFTHTPGEILFSGEMSGKTLYFAMRWENTRGVKGPWNEIQSVIIP